MPAKTSASGRAANERLRGHDGATLPGPELKILHLTPDEKFVGFTQRIYEAAFPGANRYLVHRKSKDQNTFVQPAPNVRHVAKPFWFSADLQREVAACDCLIVHFMNPWFAKAVLVAPKNVLVVWSGWGGDYYDYMGDYKEAMLLPKTQALTQAQSPRSVAWLKSRSKHLLAEGSKRLIFGDWTKEALPRIDVVSVYPSEYPLLQKSLPHFRARLHQLYYFSVEDVFLKGPPTMDGPDILLGNSAIATNNHLDAFDMLAQLDLGDRRIIAPLSYGDAYYAEAVAQAGKKCFGARFTPLRDYMPIDEYNKVISACGVVWMNHVRQQAVGNVSTAIYKGAKVYLRPENLVNPFYREMGVTLFDVPKADLDTQNFFIPLTAAQKATNKAALDAFWTFDSLVAKTARLADFLPG